MEEFILLQGFGQQIVLRVSNISSVVGKSGGARIYTTDGDYYDVKDSVSDIFDTMRGCA